MRVRANGISINYEINGQGDNIVLIHGAFDNLDMWYNQVPIFSNKYRVITYDLRGFGKTESPEGEYSISLFAEDLYEFSKAIGIESGIYIGFSLGGSIAVHLAIEHPEIVKAIVMANSSAGLAVTTPPPNAQERFQTIQDLLDKGEIRKAAEMMTAAALSPNFSSKNPAEFERYVRVKLQNDPQTFARVMRSLRREVSKPDVNRLICPTLIIVGENDSVMGPEQGKQVQQAIPNSKLAVVAAGHASAIERPDQFNTVVLDFISEVIAQ